MLPTNQTLSVSSERRLITINIETLAGSSFELIVSTHEQIQSIKRRIEQREGIPVSHQHLVWRSTELDDESCLHDHSIDAGTTIKLVLAMRGGPVNTKRVPMEDSFIRDMSEYIENSRDDGGISSDLLPSSNKNVTFLVLRDGDQFNFFQVIDRGDESVSPLSGSVSNASMYNTHETVTVDAERESHEKRQADDRKTKQKMELIRSKLKTHTRKDNLPLRPPSATKPAKPSLTYHPSRNILVDRSSNVKHTSDRQPSATSSFGQHRILPMTCSATDILNSYNFLSAAARGRSDLLHEDDSDDDEDSHDEDDDQLHTSQQQFVPMNSQSQPSFASRSFSPSVLYHTKHRQYEEESPQQSLYHSHYQDRSTAGMISKHDSASTLDTYAPNSINTMLSTNYPSVTLGPVSQETAMATTATSASTVNDTSASAVLVDYMPRISPTLHKQPVSIVSRSSRLLSAIATKRVNVADEPSATNMDTVLSGFDEKLTSNSEIIYQQSHVSPMLELIDDGMISPSNGFTSVQSIHADKTDTSRKQTAEIQSRNDTSLSRPIWTDDDDQFQLGDEYTPGGRTSTSQSLLPHHRDSATSATIATPAPTLPGVAKKSTLPSATQQFYHYPRPTRNDPQQAKASPRPPKYERMPSNLSLTATLPQQTFTSASKLASSDAASNGNGTSASRAADSFNEHLMLNRRLETLKTPGKQQSTASNISSPSSSSAAIFPPTSFLSRRYYQQQEPKATTGATHTLPPPSSSVNTLDNTKVTIETIGPKTASALFRPNTTIEPVDTSRGVGRHLVSLLTTASKETASVKNGHKHASRDAVIEERYKLDSKLTNPWANPFSNTPSTVTSSLQFPASTSQNANKLPPVNMSRKSTSKCYLCKKKTGLATTYQCRCGSSFCSEHRYPEAHACAFDYKADGKRLIERNNPLVTAPKLPKI